MKIAKKYTEYYLSAYENNLQSNRFVALCPL